MLCCAMSYPSAFVIIAVGWESAPSGTCHSGSLVATLCGILYSIVKQLLEQLRTERQSARMSKITNDGLTRSGTGCFIAVPIGNSRL